MEMTEKQKLMREQLELKKIGKRRCSKCRDILDLSKFGINGRIYRRTCKLCESTVAKAKWHTKQATLSLEEAIAYKFYQARYRSKEKDRQFALLVEDVKKQWERQNGRCHYSGIEMTTKPKNYNYFSIDRVDSLKGYSADNIVLCCHTINLMKKDMPEEVFLDYCEAIVKHRRS